MSLKIGVLISGSGTNLQAIIDRIAAGTLDAEVVLVVSSRPSAYGLKRAEAAGIQTLTLSKEIYAEPAMADEIIAASLKKAGAEYCSNGFKLSSETIRKLQIPLLSPEGFATLTNSHMNEGGWAASRFEK